MEYKLEYVVEEKTVHLYLKDPDSDTDRWLICSSTHKAGFCVKCRFNRPGKDGCECPPWSSTAKRVGICFVSSKEEIDSLDRSRILKILKQYPKKPFEEIYINVLDYMGKI